MDQLQTFRRLDEQGKPHLGRQSNFEFKADNGAVRAYHDSFFPNDHNGWIPYCLGGRVWDTAHRFILSGEIKKRVQSLIYLMLNVSYLLQVYGNNTLYL